ncbi:hypothetical protein N7539_008616 [Penicillium diatomitis]|uniref:Actin-like ATPase domain-containing protein n=1 Tax=Penicillium diatomitis TaxID=2819901 RepID=A0A9W9WQX6_9EURO|nr:uncharacterized protein N7539_008582 [Penicillium diatomitis]XP_056786593.1 uncharacterized protein N7539_008616 [Penicillium diatomitis]KAJ5472013.1 hypothetical protein N7539_008582 [Penicillium diatomitis]KAJ5472047.1 hypothetical protein N7539_008616 [Penicillium diatomitis]
MAQTQERDIPQEVWLGIDIGTTTTKVGISVIHHSPKKHTDYTLQFPLSGAYSNAKMTDELDSAMIFNTETRAWSFGSAGLTVHNAHVFRCIKLGVMGLDPYAGRLAASCARLVGTEGCPEEFTVASLFRTLFEIDAWLTYPVNYNEPLRVLLLQEAMAAGLYVRGALSEPVSAAYLSEFKIPEIDDTRMILDIGGVTMDATVVHKNADGCLIQACPSDGVICGGQSVNDRIRDWLRMNKPDWADALNEESRWDIVFAPIVNLIKEGFNGISGHDIHFGLESVTVPPDCIKASFEPLLVNAVELCVRLHDATPKNYDISVIIVCGGTTRNDWFTKELFARLQQRLTELRRYEIMADPGVVALGALFYARSPTVEESLITRDLGVTYLGDYDSRGNSLDPHSMNTGIGWILRKGQDPEKVPGILTFTKMIQPFSSEPGDTLIESHLLATPAHSTSFADAHIRKNTQIVWPCDITYPAKDKDLRSLSHLGTFSGSIQHEILFPPGSDVEEQVKFQLCLINDRQLLRGDFSVILPTGSHPLRDGIFNHDTIFLL